MLGLWLRSGQGWGRVRVGLGLGLEVGLGASELLIDDWRYAIQEDRVPVPGTGYMTIYVMSMTTAGKCRSKRCGRKKGTDSPNLLVKIPRCRMSDVTSFMNSWYFCSSSLTEQKEKRKHDSQLETAQFDTDVGHE